MYKKSLLIQNSNSVFMSVNIVLLYLTCTHNLHELHVSTRSCAVSHHIHIIQVVMIIRIIRINSIFTVEPVLSGTVN